MASPPIASTSAEARKYVWGNGLFMPIRPRSGYRMTDFDVRKTATRNRGDDLRRGRLIREGYSTGSATHALTSPPSIPWAQTHAVEHWARDGPPARVVSELISSSIEKRVVIVAAGEGGHGPLKRQPSAHAIELGEWLYGKIDHHALDHGGTTKAVFKFSFWDVDFRKQNSRRTSSD
jgi:hypothetical protein